MIYVDLYVTAVWTPFWQENSGFILNYYYCHWYFCLFFHEQRISLNSEIYLLLQALLYFSNDIANFCQISRHIFPFSVSHFASFSGITPQTQVLYMHVHDIISIRLKLWVGWWVICDEFDLFGAQIKFFFLH